MHPSPPLGTGQAPWPIDPRQAVLAPLDARQAVLAPAFPVGTMQPASPRPARAATSVTWVSAAFGALHLVSGLLLLVSGPIYTWIEPNDETGIGYVFLVLPLLIGSLVLTGAVAFALGIPALVLSIRARRTRLIAVAGGSLAVSSASVIILFVAVSVMMANTAA